MIHSCDIVQGTIGNRQVIGAVADYQAQNICQLLRIDVSYFHTVHIFRIEGCIVLTVDGEGQTFNAVGSLERKAMTNLGNILKSRDTTLPTKVCIVKAMVFSVVMYGCESWAIKKAVVHVHLFATP